MILNQIVKFKNNFAISNKSEQITYYELVSNVKNLIKLIKNQNIKSKDLIAVEMEDSHFFIIAALACIEGGYSFLPLNYKMSNFEKKKILDFSKPSLIIKIKNKKYIFKKENNISPNFKKQICIFFTSGTTAFPKGVCHTPQNLIKNAKKFNQTIKVKRKQNFLHLFPMYYMAGFLNSIICPLIAGNKIVIFDKSSSSNYIHFWEEIAKNKINYFWASPSIINIIQIQRISLNLLKEIQKELNFIMVGTAPFHEQLKKKFRKKFNVKCLESYGSSEMLLVSTNLINKSFGSGKILNGITIKKDRKKNLLISSPFKFFGYLKKNRLIEINKDRYFNSGDTFKKKNQFIKIIGRTKEIIIKEGINISPKQIEDEFLKIKFVDEAGVIGVKHSLYGEVPVAFVKLNKKIETDYIIKNLKKKLSEKLIPQEIIFVNEIPKNRIGKIDKNKLKKKYDNRPRSFKS